MPSPISSSKRTGSVDVGALKKAKSIKVKQVRGGYEFIQADNKPVGFTIPDKDTGFYGHMDPKKIRKQKVKGSTC